VALDELRSDVGSNLANHEQELNGMIVYKWWSGSGKAGRFRSLLRGRVDYSLPATTVPVAQQASGEVDQSPDRGVKYFANISLLPDVPVLR
jgi:hypothetical protein